MAERQDPDQDLVRLALEAPEADTRAFEALVQRHQDMVVTNCRYITRSPSDAQDLAQEVFLKAFFGLKRFEGRASFKSWVQRIKVNHCLNFLRGRKDATFVDVDDEVTEADPGLQMSPEADKNLERSDDRARISAVLESLSEPLRVALVLRDLDGLSYEEISQTVGIGLSATKMRIKRAREEFRARYEALSQAEEEPS